MAKLTDLIMAIFHVSKLENIARMVGKKNKKKPVEAQYTVG